MAGQVQVYTLKKNEGAYRTGAKSGLIAGVAAGDATNGALWSARWAPPVAGASVPDKRRFAVISRFRARWFTISGFTAAQEVALDLFKLTGFTAPYTAGTGLVPTPHRTTFPTSIMTGQMALAVQLTAGTQTLAAEPYAGGAYSELAAGATVGKGFFDLIIPNDDFDRYPLILAPNEGLMVRNAIALGAGGTGRLIVEMDWDEVERY